SWTRSRAGTSRSRKIPSPGRPNAGRPRGRIPTRWGSNIMRKLLQPVWDYVLELWRFLADGWGRFWFTPSDPTTVAFIRICTGLVLTYIYATCLGEVENFVGGSAWVDAAAMSQLRDVNQLERLSPDGKFTEMQRKLHDSYYPSVYLLTSNPVAVRII